MKTVYDKLIFELSSPGKKGSELPLLDVEKVDFASILPAALIRKEAPALPCVSEPEAVRHYTQLSEKNYGVDSGFYPLGSCTMKYNPKFNEDAASMEAFSALHPLQSEDDMQGILEMLSELEEAFCTLTGMDAFSLSPAAGAHGELAGLMIIRAWHEKRGDAKRKKIIVPDSSHGTNPASAAIAGFEIVSIKSGKDGLVSLEALKEVLSEETAGLMLTNPNTLGLFETQIAQIAGLVHEAGGLLYYDGANMNAVMGIARPADMGFDVMHLNVHKTFSAPHGGGGPGSGPIGVKGFLKEFLPSPVIGREGDRFVLKTPDDSIGQVRSWYGSIPVLIKAYAYILSMGGDGLLEASQMAVLNANYIKEQLKDVYKLPYPGPCMHEFVFDGLKDSAKDVHTLDVAKRLIDYGYHPPTIYFPLIVPNAIMIEPTETESRLTLDDFVAVMKEIAHQAVCDPENLTEAPHNTPVRRIDETRAAKHPVLTHARTIEGEKR